jgi:hypothetical protein
LASGYSISGISDIDATGNVDNVIANKRGRTLKELSVVDIYLTRESVDVQAAVTVGGTEVFPQGPVNIETVAGSLPSTQDDRVITTIGQPNDEIIIAGTNANAAAQELRALVKVMPLDDAAVVSALNLRGAK